MNMSKFYEEEQPELLIVKGSEFRLYKSNNRLSVSKPQWTDKDGDMHMGKTVSIDLDANKGNQELIELLMNTIEILKG